MNLIDRCISLQMAKFIMEIQRSGRTILLAFNYFPLRLYTVQRNQMHFFITKALLQINISLQDLLCIHHKTILLII
jgi:hypothetical protein